MQVVYSNYCNVTPIDSNFQIYSLTDYDFLSLIHSNFSRQIRPYFSEYASLRMDVCVPGAEMKSPTSKFRTWPCHILYELGQVFLHLSSVSVNETGDKIILNF